MHLTCPRIGHLHRDRWAAHLVHVSTLSGWVSPYPAGYGFPVPFGCRPSLLGPSSSHRRLGHSLRSADSAYRPPRRLRWGSHVPHEGSNGWGGCLLYSGVAVSAHGARRHPMSLAQQFLSLCLTHHCRLCQPSFRQPAYYGASSKVHGCSSFQPFPCPVGSDGSTAPWASPSCFRPRRYQRRLTRWERIWTLIRVGSQPPLSSCDLVSQRLICKVSPCFKESSR
jgi:hypothetical protein